MIKKTPNGKVVFDYENLILPFRCYQTLIRKNMNNESDKNIKLIATEGIVSKRQ